MVRRSAVVVRALALALGGLAIALAPAWGEGTETLGPANIQLETGTGIVAAGVGLRNDPQLPASGIIDIDVPGSVKQVLVYWDGQMGDNVPGDDTIIIDGIAVTGDLIGGPTFLFNVSRPGLPPNAYGSAFRADITGLGLVGQGPNSLTVEGLEGFTRLANGAGVLVIFEDPAGTPGPVQIVDGLDFAFFSLPEPRRSTVAQTFAFPAEDFDRTATLSMFFSSVVLAGGPPRPSSIEVTVAGTTTLFSNLLASEDGLEHDTLNLPIAIAAGADSLTVQAFSRDDGVPGDPATGQQPSSLAWTAAALALPEPVCEVELDKTCCIPEPTKPSDGENICDGKAVRAVFEIVGGDCDETTNDQYGMARCKGYDDPIADPASDVVTVTHIHSRYCGCGNKLLINGQSGPVTVDLAISNTIEFTSITGQLPYSLKFKIEGAGGRQYLRIYTSCYKPLRCDDRFGAVQLVELESTLGGVVDCDAAVDGTETSCVAPVGGPEDPFLQACEVAAAWPPGATVEYQYTVTSPLTNLGPITVTVEDDPDVDDGDPTTVEIGSGITLDPGEEVTLFATRNLSETTTNQATVTAVSDGVVCEATDEVTVEVVSRPPCGCDHDDIPWWWWWWHGWDRGHDCDGGSGYHHDRH